MDWSLIRTALSWMFINLMVSVGLVSVAAYPPLWRTAVSARGRFWRDVVAASVMAVFCLFLVWKVGTGMQIDIRNVPLALAGWTYGVPGAAIVGAVIVLARASIGGPGAVTTVYLTILCVALVPLYHGRPKTLRNLTLVALAQTACLYMVGQLYYDKQPPGLEPLNPMWLLITAIQVFSLWIVSAQVENLYSRQRLQRDLSRALRSKEAMLQVIPHAIFVLDADGQVTDANQAACQLVGCDVLPREVAQHAEIAAALKERRPVSGCRLTVADARLGERIMLVSTVPLEDGTVLLGMENVTTVVRQEREEARRDRLELLGRMAAMAAHEIKNPLTTIKGFLQLLARRPEFSLHRTTFGLVQNEVEHINRVVGDFLDLSRTTEQQPESIALDALLHEIIASMELQFPDNPVSVTMEGQADLQVVADRKALKQILRNLIANAYEAMTAGGRLVLRREVSSGATSLWVTDSGPGIAPEVLATLFTPYTTTKSTGTGLGLAISQKLATELGAELTVTSEPQRGTTFRLVIPHTQALTNAAAGRIGE
ncbi:MAG TPA: ATP-binding protein [Symbiobacteriaceae bacterium]|nr:ATP-binding protein [Symbiobacteriaceae bacterium]